jgi:hypothetical protein
LGSVPFPACTPLTLAPPGCCPQYAMQEEASLLSPTALSTANDSDDESQVRS